MDGTSERARQRFKPPSQSCHPERSEGSLTAGACRVKDPSLALRMTISGRFRIGRNLRAMVIRRINAADVIDLRHAILREGLRRETAIFEGDDNPEARHYGAFEDGRLIGCVTLHPSKWQDTPAWQLRGMAVVPELRSQGVGKALIEFLEQ